MHLTGKLPQIPNAGIAEAGAFDTVQFVKGQPVPPNLATIQVNLIGVLYSTLRTPSSLLYEVTPPMRSKTVMHLALHYLPQNRTPGSLKAVVLIGSMGAPPHPI